MSNEKIVILSDIGAQTKVFENALTELGINPEHPIITDPSMVIIQVGDIVRGSLGLDSYGSSVLADRLLRLNPGRYHQLLGNHDLTYLGGYKPDHWRVEERVAPILDAWWTERLCCLAVVIRREDGNDILITHAGLTRARWESIGKPWAMQAASIINARVGTVGAVDERIGFLPHHEAFVPDADTQWAEVGKELLEGWMGASDIPFHQIHGHASPLNWDGGFWWDTVSARAGAATEIFSDARVAATRVGTLEDGSDAYSTAVDWTLGNEPREECFRPWVIRGTVLG